MIEEHDTIYLMCSTNTFSSTKLNFVQIVVDIDIDHELP